MDHQFIAAPIEEIRDETPAHIHLAFTAPEEFSNAYTIPGQYVQVQVAGLKPAFFAIASGPARKRLEFLVKRGAPASDALAVMKSGDALHVSRPAGKGYPLAKARGRDIFIVGAGSGIAPLRALLHTLLLRRAEFGQVHFIYGARKAGLIPYGAELEQWKAAGIRVDCVCSQPDAGSWNGKTGHVQDLLRAARPDASNAAAFVCGMKPMAEAVTAALVELGLASERVYQNF